MRLRLTRIPDWLMAALTAAFGEWIPSRPVEGPVREDCRRLWLAVLALAAMLLLAGLAVPRAVSAGEKIAPAFGEEAAASIRSSGAVDLIVVYDDDAVRQDIGRLKAESPFPLDRAALQAHKSRAFATLKGNFARRYGAQEMQFARDYSHLPMALLRVRSDAALRRLMDDPMVRGISKDEIHELFLAQSLPLIQQPAVASAGYRGEGTTVVVLDTGVDYTRAEFGSCTSPGEPSGCRVVHAADIAPDDGQRDDMGHGTNVSAIVAGVAPAARLAVLDVFQGSLCWSSDEIAGINWAIANQASYNIVAINLSLGGGSYSSPIADPADPIKSAIDNARAAGILTVAASGNSGFLDALSSPAAVDTAISVGAVYDSAFGSVTWNGCGPETGATDKVTCFSNSASFLTMLAPGALISAGGITMGGTSQASPQVAGGVAVLRSAFPSDSLDQTVARLRKGAPVVDPRNGVTKPRLDLESAGILTPADTTLPEVTAWFPVRDAPDASTTTAVTATFSEALDPLTVTTGTFVLLPNGSSIPVNATVSYDAATRTAMLSPTSSLALGTTYTATVKGGLTNPRVKDLAGNALAADEVWSFTTPEVDTTPPTVSSVSPANLAAGVSTAAAVTATFDEQVDAGTVTAGTFLLRDVLNNPVPAVVSYNAATRTATLTPAGPLTFLSTYTATVKGGASRVKDLVGNALAADFTWAFTTAQSGVLPPDTTVFSAVLPVSRSARVGLPVTVLGTIMNAGVSHAAGCRVALSADAPAGLALQYQTTHPTDNHAIGLPNTPVNLAPGASQSFMLAFTPSSAFDPVDLPVVFDCENSSPAGVLLGINTLLLSASTTSVPDLVALVATLTNDGIVNIPGVSGTGAFAVASVNVGAPGAITVAADTGGTTLPVALTVCETNPGTGQCLQPPAASVSTTIANGATPTFAIFVKGNGSAVALNPAVNRVFVRFREDSITGTVRGATSVAVRTQ